jgi:hypothetical protein
MMCCSKNALRVWFKERGCVRHSYTAAHLSRRQPIAWHVTVCRVLWDTVPHEILNDFTRGILLEMELRDMELRDSCVTLQSAQTQTVSQCPSRHSAPSPQNGLRCGCSCNVRTDRHINKHTPHHVCTAQIARASISDKTTQIHKWKGPFGEGGKQDVCTIIARAEGATPHALQANEGP